MVRVKTRFLLIKVDTPGDDLEGLGKKELERCLRDQVLQTHGVAASGTITDMQVRFWDAQLQILLLRVLRDDARQIRASLVFLNTIRLKSTPTKPIHVALSIRSVHGSARTAKRALLLAIRTHYQSITRQIRLHNEQQPAADMTKQLYPIAQQWQTTVETVLNTIDY